MKHTMSIRDHVRISTVLVLVGFAIFAIGGMCTKPLQPHWLLWVGLGIFLVALVYRLITVKCPHCGDMLLGCRVLPKYCPCCGKELDR